MVAGTNYLGNRGFFLQSGMRGNGEPFDGEALDVYLNHVTIAERGGEVEFYFRIDSEHTADVLRFFIDGREMTTGGFPVSGRIPWKLARFAFPAEASLPFHDFRWRYEKDKTTSSGRDVACIDHITIFGVVGDE